MTPRFMLVMVVLSSALCAQSIDRLGMHALVEPIPPSYFTRFEATASGILVDNHTAFQTQTAVLCVGALCHIGASDFLLAGHDGNSGRIQHWRATITGWALLSQRVAAGKDYSAVVFDAPSLRLYFVEAETGELQTASWTPATDLSTIVPSTILTSSSWPGLRILPTLELVEDPNNAGQFLPRLYNDFVAFVEEVVVTGISSPTFTEAAYFHGTPTDSGPHIDWTTLSEGLSTVTVFGAESDILEVVEVGTDSVIGSAQVGSGQDSAVVALTSVPVIGESYVSRLQGTTTRRERAVECGRRYGEPIAAADGTAVGFLSGSNEASIGNGDFILRADITSGVALTQAIDLTAGALVGYAVRSSAGIDPIVTGSWGGPTLALSLTTPVASTGHINENGRGIVVAPLPIPDDANLVGSLVFYQFGVTVPGGTVTSEVMGVVIKG